ncbi:MAG: hypothetical protein GF315_00265 [candidate division Zixibacteria bacterium]|nr:hypothetical protein [candidate division Zixibacteria bacterium]
MIVLGAIGVYMMTADDAFNPLLTIFFYSIPSNCAVALFPHEPVLVKFGKTINLWHLATAASLGTIVAAIIDYQFFTPILNLSYSRKYKSHQVYKAAHKWFYKSPFLSLVVASFSPIPFYPFKLMVYASKYSFARYLIAISIGRFPRYYILGLAGYTFRIPDWIIIGTFVAMILMVYFKKIYELLNKAIVSLFTNKNKELAVEKNTGKYIDTVGD